MNKGVFIYVFVECNNVDAENKKTYYKDKFQSGYESTYP